MPPRQNLNRDYMKADAPETPRFSAGVESLATDFFVDDHVTDGADYQYDVTFSIETDGPVSGGYTRRWSRNCSSVLTPMATSLHLTWSFGVAAAILELPRRRPRRASPPVLPCQQTAGNAGGDAHAEGLPIRVTGNYSLLRACSKVVNRDAAKLVEANQRADRETVERGQCTRKLALRREATGESEPFAFKGYRWKIEHSEISGDGWVQYSHEPVTITVPRQSTMKATAEAKIPAAYLVPAQWTEVIARLDPRSALEAADGTLDRRGRELPAATPEWGFAFEGIIWPAWHDAAKTPACIRVRETMNFPSRFGGGSDGTAGGTHRDAVAGAGGTGFGVAMGIVRQHL